MTSSMRTKLTTAALLGVLVAAPVAALAQAGSSTSGNPAVRTDDSQSGTGPAAGANSFTEGQAQSRFEDAGFRDVTGLQKDEQGIWRGRAMRNGMPTDVALDFKGEVFSGTAATVGTATSRDRTPGNPPGTAAGRAADQALGTNATGANPGGGRPDGTPGNPPGTAAGRAIDRTLGTNTTGANPGGNGPDGTPGNPPSTAVGRAVDRAQGQASQPDGTPGNPPGTAAGRAVDRTLGTNSTGANPAGNSNATSPAR